MYHTRSALRILSIPLALAACTEEATTPLEPMAEEAIEALAFHMPPLDRAVLSPTTINERLPEPEDGPQATEVWGDLDRPLQAIFGAKTLTGFYTGMAWAEGQQSYIGNVGSVETTARVTIEDKYLADQVAKQQDYIPFLLDFGRKKFISVFAPVHTDHTCGLTVRGSSFHAATWQFFQGTGVSNWGQAIQSSTANPSSQSPCESGPTTGQVTVGSPSTGGSVCYYLVTYDLGTGQIYSAQLLFCSSASDEKW